VVTGIVRTYILISNTAILLFFIFRHVSLFSANTNIGDFEIIEHVHFMTIQQYGATSGSDKFRFFTAY
jgi:hypothetical protein